MSSPSVTDLSFYALVHHVLDASRDDDDRAERRGGGRRSFSCLQWIAPYLDGKLPTAEQFCRVQCLDLSAGGFSFIADESMEAEFLVVALGNQPLIFVTAEVVRRSWKQIGNELQLVIGCRFIGRLESEYRPAISR